MELLGSVPPVLQRCSTKVVTLYTVFRELNIQKHRIIQYPKLERTHKDHRVQLWAPRSTTQKSELIYQDEV